MYFCFFDLIVIVLDSTHGMVTRSKKSVMERALSPKFHFFSLFLVLTLGKLLLIFLSICFPMGKMELCHLLH